MAFHRLVGLNVIDGRAYQEYRRQMGPVMERYGGQFVYDFVVGEALVSQTTHPVNRVFVMRFETREKCESFFGDPAYKQVRGIWFEKAVSGVTVLAEWEK